MATQRIEVSGVDFQKPLIVISRVIALFEVRNNHRATATRGLIERVWFCVFRHINELRAKLDDLRRSAKQEAEEAAAEEEEI